MNHLEDLVKAAAGRPVILFNPILDDRPSSNNLMQVRGRAERQEFSESFQDIFALRLLYPSSGGYMYPIRGMIGKKSFHSPWVLYSKEVDKNEREIFQPIAALDPYVKPSPSFISDLFLAQK